jgi:hypothetical protein
MIHSVAASPAPASAAGHADPLQYPLELDEAFVGQQ